ncbi:hypothetical protein [Mesobacillus subterraneus]|uniref:SpoVT-AbrB domain-containing protein n=1 Tax=Mesobacillus subterraneus TaxID=285983 RepID=A0A3R9EZZ3_9BACI|nr:hypothetical protein [Mesobacillus subterraneus]RSD26993.1 hypothetical protein EJA10_10625 [Mesobacillus subterraneus]
MEPYRCKEFNKYGLVRLPGKWRKQLNFTPGKLVDIVYKKDTLLVRKHMDSNTENTRVISSDGTITIPAEFKRLMGLTPEDEICVFVDKENECFIIKTM